MAIAFVQGVGAFTSPGVTLALPAPPTAGNLLVLMLMSEGVASGFSPPVGWTLVRQSVSSATTFSMAIYKKLAAGASDQTIACGQVGGANCGGIVHEYSGASSTVVSSGIADGAAGAAGGQLPAMGAPASGLLVGYAASNAALGARPRFYTARFDPANQHSVDAIAPLPLKIGVNAGVEVIPTNTGAPTVTSPTMTVPPNTVVTLAFDDIGVGGAYFHNISFDGDAGVNNFVGGGGSYSFTRTTPNDGSSHAVRSQVSALGHAVIDVGSLSAPGTSAPAYDASNGWFGSSGGGWTVGQVLFGLPAAASAASFGGEPGGSVW